MKQFFLFLFMLCTGFVQHMAAQVSFGQPVKFNDGWLFTLADDSLMANRDYDDAGWRKLDLPHDWSVEGIPSPELASCTGYLPGGIAWYRKHFKVTDTAARHYIYFEGIYNRSEVYINGKLLGKRPNGYISFMYDLTPYLTEGENILAVRVDHHRYADSRWYTGSGIYRDVWMISAPEIHIAQWGIGWTVEKLTDRSARIKVDVEIEKHRQAAGKMNIRTTLYDAEGKMVTNSTRGLNDLKPGKTKEWLTLNVGKPKRWSVKQPYLYTLKTELLANGKCIDTASTKIGLRIFTFDANRGFALNGEWMKVKGVCLHHDAGALGAAVPEEVWERRLLQVKNVLGANAIRMSHNPQSPVVYDICDRIGLLVMDEASDEWEFPKRKWIEGWNVGKPSFDGSFDFFEQWIEQDVTDMVRRDRRHASVFMWSIGNEVDYPNDPYSHPILDGSTINQPMFGGYNPKAPDAMRIGEIAKKLAACVRVVDTSRPVTGALAGVVMSNQTAYPQAVDVVGYNYTENRYDTDHLTYPKRIIYGSETSSGIEAWHAVRDRKHIFGQFVWTGTDYLGESGRWPSRGLGTGLLDFTSRPKPRGYHRAALWREDPVTYIGTYPKTDRVVPDAWDIWNYKNGEMIRVVCYTNAPQARLLLNGRVVGEMKPYDDKSGIIYWDIPYESGVLKAEGCDLSGRVLSDYTIKSSGRPFTLHATVDKSRLNADKGVAHIQIHVLDEQGTIVKLADNMITCEIEGPARLLGLENGDNTDMSLNKLNHRRAYHGYLLSYVQAVAKGTIRVKFTSPLLGEQEVVIIAE